MLEGRTCLIALVVVTSGFGQSKADDQPKLDSLDALVGKNVIVQRMPLCTPGTFTTVLSYAAKQAVVVSLKPSNISIPPLSPAVRRRLPPETVAMMDDQRKAMVILVRFEDGATLDTCGPVSPTKLSTYFEIVPGQIPAAANQQTTNPASMSTMVASFPAQQCPVTVTKATSTSGGFRHALADSMTKSTYERAVERASNGGHDPHYLDVRMRNNSAQAVKAIEAIAAYTDKMGDRGAQQPILSQNEKDIPPKGEYKGYAVDTAERWRNGIGEVTVYVTRVRFQDNSFWQDNGSHSCSLTTNVKP
jgi:hypothetical protein